MRIQGLFIKCVLVLVMASFMVLACKDEYVQIPTIVAKENADSTFSEKVHEADMPSSQVLHGLKATFYLTNQAGDTTTRFRVGENIFFHLELCNVSDTAICLLPPQKWTGDDFFYIEKDEGNRIGTTFESSDPLYQDMVLVPKHDIKFIRSWYLTKSSNGQFLSHDDPVFLKRGSYKADCVFEPCANRKFTFSKRIELSEEDFHKIRILEVDDTACIGAVEITYAPRFSPENLCCGVPICSRGYYNAEFCPEDIPILRSSVGEEVDAYLMYVGRTRYPTVPNTTYACIKVFLRHDKPQNGIVGKWFLSHIYSGINGEYDYSDQEIVFTFCNDNILEVDDKSIGKFVFLSSGQHHYTSNVENGQLTLDDQIYQFRLEDNMLIIDAGSAWDAPVYYFKQSF